MADEKTQDGTAAEAEVVNDAAAAAIRAAMVTPPAPKLVQLGSL